MIKNTKLIVEMILLSLIFMISCVSSQPTQPSSPTASNNIYSISSGKSHVCTLDKSSSIKCWGTSLYGENGSKEDEEVPKEISLDSSFSIRGITSGWYHSCFVTDKNEVYCWGDNSKGQLGTLKVKKSFKPLKVNLKHPGNDKIMALSLGEGFSCALFQSGAIKCWGDNSKGQLGTGSSGKQELPSLTKIGTKDPAVSIKSGNNHSCALLKSNRVKCWGDNSKGQLLNVGANFINIPEYINLSKNEPIRNLILKSDTSCILNNEGIAKCWGHAPVLFGVKSIVTTPLNINPKAFPKLKSFSMGDGHVCYLSTKGQVQCMGSNSQGQLGTGTTEDSTTPVNIQLNEKVKSMVSSDNFNCALLKKGNVKCWGDGSNGRLGDGNSTSSSLPVDISF